MRKGMLDFLDKNLKKKIGKKEMGMIHVNSFNLRQKTANDR